MARSSKAKEPPRLEIDGVPTAAGLASRGRHLAYVLPDGKYHITDAGHAALGEALRDKGRAITHEWIRPPSSGKERDQQ